MNCKERKSYLLPCPFCHEKTDVKIHEDTTLLYFPLQCPYCKQETLIHVNWLVHSIASWIHYRKRNEMFSFDGTGFLIPLLISLTV